MSLSAMFAALRSPVATVPPVAVDESEESFRRYIGTVRSALDNGEEVRAKSAIHVEARIIDAKTGTVDYIASDETLDSYREAIKASGWQFTRFKKNAPFVDSHDYSTIGQLVGKVTDFKVVGKQLVERVQWAIEPEIGNELAQFGFKMTEGGYLKAVSVGFIPVKMATRWDGDESAWQAAVTGLKLSAADAAIVRAIYLQQEQFELSACIIGANGNAVAKAHKAGVLTDSELDRLTDLGQKKLSQYAVETETGFASLHPADATAKVRGRGDFIRELTGAVAELRTLTNRS